MGLNLIYCSNCGYIDEIDLNSNMKASCNNCDTGALYYLAESNLNPEYYEEKLELLNDFVKKHEIDFNRMKYYRIIEILNRKCGLLKEFALRKIIDIFGFKINRYFIMHEYGCDNCNSVIGDYFFLKKLKENSKILLCEKCSTHNKYMKLDLAELFILCYKTKWIAHEKGNTILCEKCNCSLQIVMHKTYRVGVYCPICGEIKYDSSKSEYQLCEFCKKRSEWKVTGLIARFGIPLTNYFCDECKGKVRYRPKIMVYNNFKPIWERIGDEN